MLLVKSSKVYLGRGLVSTHLGNGLHMQQEDVALLVQVEEVVEPVLLGLREVPVWMCLHRQCLRQGQHLYACLQMIDEMNDKKIGRRECWAP
jgi:hypothetical protein